MSGELSANEIIRIAKLGECDFKKLSQAEKLLYLQMVNIFDGYRNKRISADEAKVMKAECVKTFEKYQMFERIFREDCRIRNTQSQWFIKAEKEGCPTCKKLVRIFDGRDTE